MDFAGLPADLAAAGGLISTGAFFLTGRHRTAGSVVYGFLLCRCAVIKLPIRIRGSAVSVGASVGARIAARFAAGLPACGKGILQLREGIRRATNASSY